MSPRRWPRRTSSTRGYFGFGCGDECANAPLKKIVFTGSHNLTSSANDLNDELCVKIENPVVYDQFVDHFETEFKNGKKK